MKSSTPDAEKLPRLRRAFAASRDSRRVLAVHRIASRPLEGKCNRGPGLDRTRRRARNLLGISAKRQPYACTPRLVHRLGAAIDPTPKCIAARGPFSSPVCLAVESSNLQYHHYYVLLLFALSTSRGESPLPRFASAPGDGQMIREHAEFVRRSLPCAESVRRFNPESRSHSSDVSS